MLEQFCETRIRYAHRCLSDIGVLRSRDLWAFICLFDRNRLPIAELERHNLQNFRDKQ